MKSFEELKWMDGFWHAHVSLRIQYGERRMVDVLVSGYAAVVDAP